jgi:hypothetical protein
VNWTTRRLAQSSLLRRPGWPLAALVALLLLASPASACCDDLGRPEVGRASPAEPDPEFPTPRLYDDTLPKRDSPEGESGSGVAGATPKMPRTGEGGGGE